ncbi:hypothetical protein PR001_g8616 [Phytophthora rubi]|uniref:Uncharacterized protein n=1 Tax=Phytophthora rubi TaxID=129364 RepID=A0A6A3N9B4_9STRA|nr:hypothetical protein PR001_g8616 [Phytophthora rubi]
MARKVWFQLLDAATRDAYADTQTESVSSDGVTDIDDLRKAIREKYRHENPDLLEGVVAGQLRIYANRAVYDDKNGQPLDEDSRIGLVGPTKRGALVVVVTAPPALRLTAYASYPAFLKKAIEIANVMLTHHKYFELELSADNTTRRNLRHVKVKFRRPEEGSLYGWSDRSARAKVIFVNEVLLHRMQMIDQADNSHEYQCIVFVVAATIFHECAHLALRWKNILDSPDKFQLEVGTIMGTKLFHGTCRVKIQQSTRATSKMSERSRRMWTKEMAILDVVIDGMNGLSVIRADHLNKFFTLGKLCGKTLFPLVLTMHRRTKGATAFRDAGRKRRRTPPEDPNILMPPLCGIPKNRYVRRRLST